MTNAEKRAHIAVLNAHSAMLAEKIKILLDLISNHVLDVSLLCTIRVKRKDDTMSFEPRALKFDDSEGSSEIPMPWIELFADLYSLLAEQRATTIEEIDQLAKGIHF